MLRHRRPTLVVDTAIAHHFEVLDDVRLGGTVITQRGQHAETLKRRLCYTVHGGGRW